MQGPRCQPGSDGHTLLLLPALVFHSVGATQLEPKFCRDKKKELKGFVFPPLVKYCSFLPPAAGQGLLGCGIVFLGKEGTSEYMCPKGVEPVKTGVIKLWFIDLYEQTKLLAQF